MNTNKLEEVLTAANDKLEKSIGIMKGQREIIDRQILIITDRDKEIERLRKGLMQLKDSSTANQADTIETALGINLPSKPAGMDFLNNQAVEIIQNPNYNYPVGSPGGPNGVG